MGFLHLHNPIENLLQQMTALSTSQVRALQNKSFFSSKGVLPLNPPVLSSSFYTCMFSKKGEFKPMGKIIAFTGAHGTGKSTAAYRLAENYKIEHPEKSVHVLCDQEALCPFPINKQTSPEAQMWVFTNQIRQELWLASKFDIIISDRTVVDAIAYTDVAGFDSLAQGMSELALGYISNYTSIKFRTIIENDFCCQDGIRETKDSLFREEIEDRLFDLYDGLLAGGNLSPKVMDMAGKIKLQ